MKHLTHPRLLAWVATAALTFGTYINSDIGPAALTLGGCVVFVALAEAIVRT